MIAATHSTFAGARLLEPMDCHQIQFEDQVHLNRYELLALELGIEDPPQPAAELKLEQVAGYGLTAARSGRDLRELLEDPERFKTYAFFSSMLNPHAGREFRRFRRHQEFRTKHNQSTGRELKHGYIGKKKYTTDAQQEQRVERITQIAEDLWWFPNASIKNISSGRGLGQPPQWIQRQWKDDTPLKEMDIVSAANVQLSHVVTANDFARLVNQFGYSGIAAWTSITHAQLQPPPDRRRRRVHPDLNEQDGDERKGYNGAGFAQPLPYIGAPSRHTKQGCGFTRRQVADVVDKMRIDLPTRRAVTKIVYARLPLKVVAKTYSIKWQTLKTYAQRARLRLRTNHQ
jgi:hypothetical protein